MTLKKLGNQALAAASIGAATFAKPLFAACAKDADGNKVDPTCVDLLDPGTTSVKGIISNVTTWVLGFIGALAVLLIIWGGFQYITSAGNKDQAEKAKKTLTYAVIGLVVVVLARAIVAVVTNPNTLGELFK